MGISRPNMTEYWRGISRALENTGMGISRLGDLEESIREHRDGDQQTKHD